MANPHKGEYRLTIEDKEYVLRFSANAICDLEDRLDMSLAQISAAMQDPEKIRMKMVRTMFYGGLADHHPELDERAARALFNALPVVDVVGHVAKAFVLAFGVEETAAAGGSGVNPPRPGAALNGTGQVSTATGPG